MKIRKPITSTPSTLLHLLDHHNHHRHQEIMSGNIQESDRAAETPSSDDVDTKLSLDSAADDIHADSHEAVTTINLAKFRNDIGFLGLGITADYCSRKFYKNDGPVDDHNRRVNPKSDVNLAKFVKKIDTSTFLGLGIDTSSDYEINRGHRVTALNPMPLRSYHPASGYMDYYSSNTSCAGKKRKREQKNNNNNTVNAKKGGKRSKVVNKYPDPISPPPELVQRIGQAIRPVFLYRKQLEEWDTRDDQNRLFVNDREKLMDFMTEEERGAVEDQKRPGIDLVGIDRMGREYGLHSNVWKSLDMAVFNKGWRKIVEDNRAKKGDWVHLWAYRRGEAGEFCLYVDFREQP